MSDIHDREEVRSGMVAIAGPPNAGWQTRYNPPSIREGILRKIP